MTQKDTARFDVVIAGLGYFSQFHLKAWLANPSTRLVGVCDPDPRRLGDAPKGVATATSLAQLLADTPADIVDIIAPPSVHAELIAAALARGRTIICQKPFARNRAEAARLAEQARAAGTELIIHENFRFQPWHRAAKTFLESGQMGRLYQARFALRPGDGRGPEAYMARQPAFQQMPRFLFQETGVHFVDLFLWLFGPVKSVYAEHQRLNPDIAGEDCGMMVLHHASGVRAIFDGNRLSDHVADDPRRTMGEMRIEGEGGVLDLDGSGALWFRPFGSQEALQIPMPVCDLDSFGGGCVAALIDHVVEARRAGQTPENTAQAYLPVMDILEAAYQSAETGQRVSVAG